MIGVRAESREQRREKREERAKKALCESLGPSLRLGVSARVFEKLSLKGDCHLFGKEEK